MKSFRILIVEDSDFFRDFLKEILQLSFPEVCIDEAEDGDAALWKIRSFLPDLIFMDIHLPGENGLELIKRIKANYPYIMIFVLTNYNLPEYREAAFQSGADRFIVKSSLNSTDLKGLLTTYGNA